MLIHMLVDYDAIAVVYNIMGHCKGPPVWQSIIGHYGQL